MGQFTYYYSLHLENAIYFSPWYSNYSPSSLEAHSRPWSRERIPHREQNSLSLENRDWSTGNWKSRDGVQEKRELQNERKTYRNLHRCPLESSLHNTMCQMQLCEVGQQRSESKELNGSQSSHLLGIKQVHISQSKEPP